MERVLKQSSRSVEVRIAKFRIMVAFLLLIFELQTIMWSVGSHDHPYLYLAVVTSILALAFSLLIIHLHNNRENLPITPLAIASIGVDAVLFIMPVSLFFVLPEVTQGHEHHSVNLLNQPSVFAMYLLVIASGFRFREVARLGIAVNGCVIVAIMALEAVNSQLPTGLDPNASLAIRQHVLLLTCSAVLAWQISSHIRNTTLLAAQTSLQASVDGLTGVYNRHQLRERLESIKSHPKTSLHLVMIDVDHFKSVNDELGHLVGDQVLIEVARRLQAALRPDDFLARYGGEEFCVLLTGVDNPMAEQIAERLRLLISKDSMEGRDITVSLGIAKWDKTEPLSQLLERADKALYQAKESGRNRVVSNA